MGHQWGRPWDRAPRTVAIATALVVAWVPLPAGAEQPERAAVTRPRAYVEAPDIRPRAPVDPRAGTRAVADVARSAALGDVPDLTRPAPDARVRWSDDEAGLSFLPPPGWVLAAATSLNPLSDPPEPVLERVRFQLRAGDASLYAAAVPVTSGIVRDAGAIISVGLAREGTDLADLRVDERIEAGDTADLAGFVGADDEMEYEGVHVLTRYLIARSGERVVVVRAYAAEDEWLALAPMLRAAIASTRADPAGLNAAPFAPALPPALAPLAPAPEPVPSAVAPPQSAPAPVVDATRAIREDILARARQLLGTPYVWGGNAPGRAMDCSAFVSATWDVARYTTDSIGRVASPISKDELRPGDAMNLTIGRDPRRFGHIRLFEAWANDAHTLVWVYEETPPRAVHRVIAYDDRYEPIRLDGLSSAGATAVVPAPPSAPERLTPGSSSPSARPVRPRATPTGRPALPFGAAVPYELRGGQLVPISSPTATPRPAATVRARPRPTARPTPRPTARPTARSAPPTSPPPPTPQPTARATPTPASSTSGPASDGLRSASPSPAIPTDRPTAP